MKGFSILLAAFPTLVPLHASLTTDAIPGFTMDIVAISGGTVTEDTSYGADPCNFPRAEFAVSKVMIEAANASASVERRRLELLAYPDP